MGGFKVSRMSEDIRRELDAIIRSLKDPRVKGVMLSIVKVDLSGDLSHAKIYISAIEGMEKTEQAVTGLTAATGFIRRELLSRLHIRRCPELKFIADDSIAQSAAISKIISSF